MIDPTVLVKHGGDPESLRAKFEKPMMEWPKELQDFIKQCTSRAQDGIDQNLRDTRLWWAVDRAFDAAQRQSTYTLVEGLINSQPTKQNAEAVLSAAKDWGLDSMLVETVQNGQKCVGLELPTFHNVLVPIVAAYMKLRWAKITNDRDLYPLYKFEPVKLTLKNKIKCEIVTDRIQRMATEMGYRDDERQENLQTLLYGICMAFPMEHWWKEEQLDENGKTYIVREGLRFAIPHPSRFFYDQTFRVSSFNTNNGGSWAGYWDVVTYGSIMSDKSMWNTDKVGWSTRDTWFNRSGGTPWNLAGMLSPCQLKFPTFTSNPGVGAGDQDRTTRAFTYTSNEADSAVTLVSMFVRCIPKNVGLYDYEYPVWHRVVLAGEDTVVYVEPLSYSPVTVKMYDADLNRSFQNSLALELIPWQDLIGNYLTQHLLSVKQNLTRIVFWNTSILNEDDVSKIRNLGEKMYRTTNLIPFSDRELKFAQTNVSQAFWPVSFPAHNTQETASAIQLMISVMERMLGFSAQELGAAASHEQSATEVNIAAGNTSTRLEFTGAFIDSGMRAKKQLLYDAMMAYSSDEVFAEIAEMNEATQKALEEMGFHVEDESVGTTAKAGVRGSKKGLKLDGFSSERDGQNRIPDAKIATAMLQSFQTIFAAPAIVETVGINQIIELYNQILYFAGLPKDWRLRIPPDTQEADKPQVAQQQIAQVLQQLPAIIQGEAKKIVDAELGQFAEVIKQRVVAPQQQIGQAVVQLAQRQVAGDQRDGIQDAVLAKLVAIIQSASQPTPMPPAPPIAPLAPSDPLQPAGVTGPAAGEAPPMGA